MKFTKLKISGFKSFVDPTFIEIQEGLTGLVGPNGCGKSNIVEAIKWNMGESGPKTLRAGEMDDLIFSGTRTRAAKNFAEVIVSITNDTKNNTNKLFNSEEINISRKITKGEGSTYKVNDQEVRQRDVQIMFADQSTGSKSNAIVDQGQVAKIINSKPEDRRKILEEAAGISGIHARKHETELKLNSTESNLEKLSEVIESDKIRLKELLKQSSQANKYKYLSEQIRELEAQILYYKLEEAKNTFRINDEKLQEYALNVSKLTRKNEELLKHKKKIEKNLPELRQTEQNIASKLNKLEIREKLLDADSSKIIENTENININIKNLEYEIDKEKEIRTKISEQIKNLNKILKQSSPNDDSQSTKLKKASNELEITKKEKEEILNLITNANKNNSENISSRKNLDLLLNKENSQLNSTKEKLQLYTEKISEKENYSQLKKDIFVTTKNINLDKNKLKQYDNDLKSASDKLVESNNNIGILNTKLSKLEQSFRETQRVIDKASSSEKLLKDLLEDNKNESILNLLSYPGHLEKAIESCLGHGLKATLDNGPIQWKKMQNGNYIPFKEKIQSLGMSFKGIEEIENILNATGIVESLDEGDKLQKELKPGQQLVSLKGDLWRWDGYKHSSEAKTPAEEMLTRKRELKEIKNKISNTNKKLKKTLLEIDLTKNLVEDKLKNSKNLETKISQIKSEKNKLNEHINTSYQTLSKYNIEKNTITTKQNMYKSTILEMEKFIEQINENIKNLISEKQKLNNPSDLENEIYRLEKLLEENDLKLTKDLSYYHQILNEVSNKKEQYNNFLNEINRHNEQIKNIDSRLSFLNNSREKNIKTLINYKDQPIMMKKEKEKIRNDINEINSLKQNAKKELRDQELLHEEINNNYNNSNEELSISREKRARQEGLCEQTKQQIENNKERIREKLNINDTELKKLLKSPLNESFIINESEEKLESLILRRERTGPVNLVAEKDASDLELKIQKLEKEKGELITAINKLRGSIGSINRESRSRLTEAFNSVNSHFKELFTKLFGGGEAYLQLEGSDDPLEAGLELMASPPGKKLQQLNLLSGGEKAITALALIFSVFLTKPSPICILDEVDAPLDDNNVDRFCDLLDDIIKECKTRFLIISHHRLTMARMDRLYGITMNEPGVSQLVSVSLKEAEFIKAAE